MARFKLKIKQGDTVQVIAGANKGHKGAVLEIDRDRLKIRVQGYRVQSRFDQQKGRIEKEAFIDYSNVKLVSAGKTRKGAATAKKSATK